MRHTTVVHCMKEDYDVYIGRGKCPKTGQISKWGNPFSHKPNTLAKFKVRTKRESLQRFREYVESAPELMDSLYELKGKVLGCWCYPHDCHGDILAELANALPPRRRKIRLRRTTNDRT